MKIGIMTFWWSEDNYGQLLQCYALQKYLRDQGHDAYLIRYDPRHDFKKSPLFLRIFKAFNPFKLYNYIKQQKNIQNSLIEQRENPRNFEEFRNKYIIQSEKIYTSYEQLKEFPPEADMYIVGSDQVWCWSLFPLKRCSNLINAFFLNFGSSQIRRVSYAASWGSDSISDEYKNIITPLLARFNNISVRETIGVELCRLCGVENAVCIPDPTFLLSTSVYYNELASLVKKDNEKFIFVYMLNNGYDFNLEHLFVWAKKKHMSIKYVTGNNLVDKYDKLYPTINEWLSLIKNAEYVISNSFHCSVFSILANKKFAVVPLSGHKIGLNSRMISLFELCNIQNRFLYNENFEILDIGYTCDLSIVQNKAEDFIKDVINEVY